MGMKRVGDLEIEEDLAYQLRFRKVERAGWLITGLLLLAALTGLIGPGLAGTDSVQSADGRLLVEFNGTVNYQKDTDLTIKIRGAEGKTVLWAKREYLDGLYLKEIKPQPVRSAADHEKIFFEFDVRGAAPEVKITFVYEPIRTGRLTGAFGEGGSEVTFRQFIFP